MKEVLGKLIAEGKELQIRLKYDPSSQPIGPGKIEPYLADGVYRIMTPAMMQAQNGQAKRIILPIVFAVEDLLWVSEGPMAVEESPIISPSGGRGGLHFGS